MTICILQVWAAINRRGTLLDRTLSVSSCAVCNFELGSNRYQTRCKCFLWSQSCSRKYSFEAISVLAVMSDINYVYSAFHKRCWAAPQTIYYTVKTSHILLTGSIHDYNGLHVFQFYPVLHCTWYTTSFLNLRTPQIYRLTCSMIVLFRVRLS